MKMDNLEIIIDNKTHRKSVYSLWQKAFHDPEIFAQYYFREKYPDNNLLLAYHMKKLVSMINYNPYSISINNKVLGLQYIVGVATDDNFRRKGIMRKLMTLGLLSMERAGLPFTYLMPAKKEYYSPFDFVRVYGTNIFKLKYNSEHISKIHEEVMDNPSESYINSINSILDKQYQVYTYKTKDYFSIINKEANVSNGEVRLLFLNEKLIGYYIYILEEDKMTITEVVCSIDYNDILRYFCTKNYRCIEVNLDEKVAVSNSLYLKMNKNYEIMFRIVNIKSMLQLVHGYDDEIIIKISDDIIKANNGNYLWKLTKEGSVVTKVIDKEDIMLSVNELAQIIFNGDVSHCTSPKSNEFFNNISYIDRIFINECV